MHKWLMENGKCLKTEMENKGIDNLSLQDLEEAYYFSKVLRNLMCVEKDGKIVEAMDEAENNDDIMSRIEMYEDYPERRYYDNYRYKTSGRFAPKGKGSYMPRRGYEEPPYYHMNPDMYREHDPEYWRDMDKNTKGVMYYTEPIATDKTHDAREGRSGMSRRSYMETKEMHKANTPEDKQQKMKELEKYMGELSGDITEMIADASAEEKSLLKAKLQTLAQKI